MYLNGECFVIRRGYETALHGSSSFCLTVPNNLVGRHSRFENDLVGQYGAMDWEEALPRLIKTWYMQSIGR